MRGGGDRTPGSEPEHIWGSFSLCGIPKKGTNRINGKPTRKKGKEVGVTLGRKTTWGPRGVEQRGDPQLGHEINNKVRGRAHEN